MALRRSAWHLAGLALVFSACGSDTTDAPSALPAETAAPAPRSETGEALLAETLTAAGDDITALPADVALNNINAWIVELTNTPFDGMVPLVQSLQELKTELGATPLDGAAIGVRLTDLGSRTAAAAEIAAEPSQDGLRRLASVLSAAGTALAR